MMSANVSVISLLVVLSIATILSSNIYAILVGYLTKEPMHEVLLQRELRRWTKLAFATVCSIAIGGLIVIVTAFVSLQHFSAFTLAALAWMLYPFMTLRLLVFSRVSEKRAWI